MKSGWTWIAMSLAAGAIAVSACGPEKSASSEGGEAASGGEPALVISDQAEWDSLLAQGTESYEAACGTCHPGGEADLGPALKGENKSSAKMTSQIRKGSGRMAPIGEDKLPEAEMKGVLVYLASLKAVGDIKGP
jgi:mono/diheme cytochrome c family protein